MLTIMIYTYEFQRSKHTHMYGIRMIDTYFGFSTTNSLMSVCIYYTLRKHTVLSKREIVSDYVN